MNVLLRASFVSLFVCALLAPKLVPSAHANGNSPDSVQSSTFSEEVFSAETRWNIKRQVMSTRIALLDMSTMIDNGYVWANDVVWVGSGLPHDKNWYIAGFLFQKPGYKSVWLQYAFTLAAAGEKIKNLKRWHRARAFR